MATRRRGNPKDPERARRKILEAAFEQFGKKGYRGTRTADVAKLAGYSEATIFHHFGTKANLFREMVNSIDAESHWYTDDASRQEFVHQMYQGEMAYHLDARWRHLDRVWAEALAGEKDLLAMLKDPLRGSLRGVDEMLARFDQVNHPNRELLSKLVVAMSYGARVLRRYDTEVVSAEEAATLLAFVTHLATRELMGESNQLAVVLRGLQEEEDAIAV